MSDDVKYQSTYIEPEDLSELLSYEQVAKILNISLPTLRRWVKRENNPLPVIRLSDQLPRVSKADLQEWLKTMSDPRQDV